MTSDFEKRLTELQARHAKQVQHLEDVYRILKELPATLPGVPSVSNDSDTAFLGSRPGAWLSFSRSYSDTWTGHDVLSALETAGFISLPATLCKWDNYRRVAEPGAQRDMPDEKPGAFGASYKLTACEPIAPLWIVPQQHGDSEARAFYRSPSGLTLKVCVPAPSGAYLRAERIDYPGGWHFKHGSARLVYPKSWPSVALNSGAYVDTEQGMSGALYFDEHDSAVTGATFCALLMEHAI